MESFDPYAPPLSEAQIVENQSIDGFREIVMGWEKLRIYFNGLLLLPGLIVLVLANQSGMHAVGAVMGGVFVAVAANLCFFLGPVAELYWCAMRKCGPQRTIRLILFWLGMLVSLGVFAVAGLMSAVVGQFFMI